MIRFHFELLIIDSADSNGIGTAAVDAIPEIETVRFSS